MTAVLNRLTLQLVLGTASAQLSSFLPCRPVLPFSSAETSSPTQRSPRPLRPSASGGADPQNKKGSDYDIPCCRRGVVSGPACRHCHRVSKVVFRRAGWHRTIPSEARFVTLMLLPRAELVECIAVGLFRARLKALRSPHRLLLVSTPFAIRSKTGITAESRRGLGAPPPFRFSGAGHRPALLFSRLDSLSSWLIGCALASDRQSIAMPELNSQSALSPAPTLSNDRTGTTTSQDARARSPVA